MPSIRPKPAPAWPTVRELAEEYHRLGHDRFARIYREPVLLHRAEEDDPHAGLSTASVRSAPELTRRGVPLNRSLSVVPIRHNLEGVFRDQIRVGRVSNNDVHLPYARISKFHAYFQRSPRQELLSLVDAGSHNGTWVDGTKLETEESVELHESSIIVFAEYSFRIVYVNAFYELMTMLPTNPPPSSG